MEVAQIFQEVGRMHLELLELKEKLKELELETKGTDKEPEDGSGV